MPVFTERSMPTTGTRMVEESLHNHMEMVLSGYLLPRGNPQLALLSSTCTKRPFNSIGDA